MKQDHHMRLGIYTSGGEALPLFTFLKKYTHDIVLYVDWNAWPIDDKSADFRAERLDLFFASMQEKEVDMIIVPPMVECAVINDDYVSPLEMMPLYTTYLKNSVFKHSLVGKIGVLSEPIDAGVCQSVLEKIAEKSDYTPEKGRSRWVKQIPLRKYYLTHLSVKDRMVRKTIKTDLRYMKDAAVDTLIPTSWAHFGYQAMISHLVSWKHMRFHGLDRLEESFAHIVDESNKKESNEYSLDIVVVGDASMLLEQKRVMQIIGK